MEEEQSSNNVLSEFQYRKRYELHAIRTTTSGGCPRRSGSIPQAVWIACNLRLRELLLPVCAFQYRKRYELHAINGIRKQRSSPVGVSIPQAVWIACNEFLEPFVRSRKGVSIPQAVWIACNFSIIINVLLPMRVSIPQAVWIACNIRSASTRMTNISSFNTASGMNCMQCGRSSSVVGLPTSFNTASGMNCMQCFSECLFRTLREVSIPQAVWIACNSAVSTKGFSKSGFQYRKRYELHAMRLQNRVDGPR